MTNTRKELGQKGERAAQEFLRRRGYRIVDTNWKCSYGEVDIVAVDKDTLVFVEVKTRKSLSAGAGEESVTQAKQKRYLNCARVFMSRHDEKFEDVRFDVISITVLDEASARLKHIYNAFGE